MEEDYGTDESRLLYPVRRIKCNDPDCQSSLL
jgi:hypothetical protein